MSGKSPEVLAVCVSPGGVPKTPVPSAEAGEMGLEGDGRDHAKHWKPERALSIQDVEILGDLRREGYELDHGTMGENLTVKNLNVQEMEPGTRLVFSGGLEAELTEPRKPCFVLDKIDPQLKEVVIGRCGYMAKVVRRAVVAPGETITVHAPQSNERAS